ncbi:Chromosome partition protein Smc [bioreactor metagenome]|uniref:Chromosome partition protein Smc n=1 Tax=bioreactor metagenome TaxID=1076179 RepID=A0A644WZM8_9ZZZZ
MKLKSIEIVGFKSFPDAVTLTFGSGITAVVGPNGSGKSNIVDAVKWVLGEQSTKSLRGGKMEDVIFSGTAIRKPTGLSEVSLVIDNADGSLPTPLSEVKVTRRLYRSGESEYLIAGRPVRLRDINELFMNTGLGRDGYSLIGQGKIAEVLSVRGEERRVIFEEAAGISKYRYSRIESERRLKSAEENLVRLRDILSGYASRVEPLRVQSEKAKKYLELHGERRQLEINIWLDAIEKSKEQTAKARIDFETVAAQLEEISAKQDGIEKSLEELSQQTAAANVGLDETVRAQRELEEASAATRSGMAVMENDIRHGTERIAQLESTAATDAKLGERLAAERETLNRQLAMQDEKKTALLCEIDAVEELLRAGEDLQLMEQIAQIEAQISDTAVKEAECRLEIGTANASLAALDENRRRRDGDKSVRETKLEEVRHKAAELEAALAERLRRCRSADNVGTGHKKIVDARTEKLAAVDEELVKLARTMAEKAERRRLLEGLEQSMEGFSGAVRAVLKAAEQGRLRSIHGTVASLIATEDKFSTAIETALGYAMQNVVTDTEGDAKAAIALLKERGAGRATFLPIATIRGRTMEPPKAGAGYCGIASQLVKTDARYREIIDNLLGRTVVAEDLDAGLSIARDNGYKFRVVTLDGQVVNSGGSMTGGSLAKETGILSRRGEITALESELSQMEARRNALRDDRVRFAEELATAKANLEAALAEGRVAKEEAIRFESELAAANKEAAGLSDEQGWLQRAHEEESVKERALTDLVKGAQATESELTEKKAELEEKTAELAGLLAAERNRLTGLRERVAALRVDALMASRDMEQTQLDLDKNREATQLNSTDSGDRTAEILRLTEENTRLRGEISKLEEAERQADIRREGLAVRAAELTTMRDEAESRQSGLRRELKETGELKEKLVKEHTRLENKLAAISSDCDNSVARLWDEYELTVSSAAALRTPVESLTAANRRIAELRGAIKELGNINIDAIEEYKEVKERYEFYTDQIEDLDRARAELDEVIGELTQQMKVIFAEQFKIINDNFAKTFADLFGGGSAKLILSDPSDVLESGIEIQVQPPGKLINNLSALSGGEQALVAIALYFAILGVRPSPFVILDEIDTALDEVNVVRLGNYYKNFTDNSQLILVTHRRGAMEAADLLYGVTMQEKGVSKVLRMDVCEVEKLRLG